MVGSNSLPIELRLSLYPKGIEKTNENGHISLYLAIAKTEELPLGWEVNAGFRLRLSLYPKGIEKTNENGHISLYLAIAKTEELPLGWEVNAGFRLFVFDQIRDEYLTVQDGGGGGGAIKRFNDVNSEWGFAKFLPLDTFNDVTQGYLVDNCYVFGVEVFVHELITRSRRHFPPNNFLLKIESYSLLSETGLEYKSDVFEAGGHKWIAETEELPLGWEVNASFRLFVFDQIRDEYLTVQDGGGGGGAIKRFNDVNSEWGFAKFLPLDTFNDVTQGYLVNNCCVFGVEVFVHERTVKRQCLSMIEEPADSTLTWKIERFSTLNEERYYSQEFTVGDSKW
nr:uncharacterized protein LOC112017162 [Quercus suber]